MSMRQSRPASTLQNPQSFFSTRAQAQDAFLEKCTDAFRANHGAGSGAWKKIAVITYTNAAVDDC
jgi:hypothetical protein